MLPSQERTYFTVDLADVNKADLEIVELPLEVLQNICLLGLPLSQLQLKVGALIMLL
jgi:hypothetical protein